MINLIVVLIGLALLLILTLRKINVAVAALVSVVFIIVFSGLPVLQTLNDSYLTGFVNFLKSVWLMLLLGAILSKIMDVSGAARSIAQLIIRGIGPRWAIPAIILAGGLLTYGGVQSMVACFALYPIALAVFRNANLPRYLIPAAIGTGIFTWVYMLPGSPAIVNIIPTKYLGTTPMAAPALGLIAAGLQWVLSLVYLEWVVRKSRRLGEGFLPDDSTMLALENSDALEREGSLPNPWLSLVPLASIAVVLNVFGQDISLALLVGIVLSCVFFWKNLFTGKIDLVTTLSDVTNQAAILAIVSSSIVGIGSVVQVTPSFKGVVDAMLASSGTVDPIIIFGAASAILAGLCASQMGGLSTALAALADPFLAMGVDPEVMHRIGVIASNSLDSLPHSGGIVAVLAISGVSYKEGYSHLFMTTVLITIVVAVVSIPLAAVLY